jgi:SHAQKYF class myb-like DNA-binding protein
MIDKDNNSMLKINSFDATEDSMKKFNNSSLIKSHLKTNAENNKRKSKPLGADCNFGRWTDQEHQLFLEAIFLYGNEWKKVQQHIKTRNSTQARSHAQKFFINIKKRLDHKDLSCLEKDENSYRNVIELEKISKLFKDCIPVNQMENLDKDKLVRFLINLKNIQNKRKTNEKINENSEFNYSEMNGIINEFSDKKKIFIIEKDNRKLLKNASNIEKGFDEYTVFSYRKDSNIHMDNFLKLKRDLKDKKAKIKEKSKQNCFPSFDNNGVFITNLLEFNSPSNIQIISDKDEEVKSNLNKNLTRSLLNNVFNEIEISYNKVFNEIDFERNDMFDDQFKCNMLNYCENENVDNLFEFNVHNSEIQEN